MSAVLAVLAVAAAMPAAPALAAGRGASDIVQLRPGVPLAAGRQIVRADGGRTVGSLRIIRALAVRVGAGGRARLAHDPRVRAITPNAAIRPQSLTSDASTSDASTTDPATTDPSATDPATTDPSATDPATTDPSATDPAPTDPSATDPATTDPVPTDPIPTDPATTDPSASAPATIDPVPTDPIPADPNAIDAPRLATAYPFSVRAPGAWQSATGAGVTVAVIDTGIDGALPDFAGAGGSSRVIATAVTNPNATTAADTYGHGTHVAGIIAGNGAMRSADDPLAGRYIGIAPDARLVSVKVGADDGSASILDVIYGLQFVVDHRDKYGIRVVNLSLESTEPQSYRTDPLDAAVESAYFSGIVVVAAAGNRGPTSDAADYAPGNDPFALSVGALDDQGTDDRSDDIFTDWSSAGQSQDGFVKPEIGAPGAHIVSTLAPGSAFTELCPACIVDGDYIRAGGTSMAAPVVSGAAALVLQAHPDWTPGQVKSTLIDSGRDVPGGIDEVNALAAVAAEAPSADRDAGIAPSDLVDSTSGAIDYTRSSWSRSSWSAAPEDPTAQWARSSWSCTCAPGASGDGSVDPTRSSWSRSSWSRSSWSTKWTY